MPTYTKAFRSQEMFEVEIENVSDGSMFGTLRVKPVSLLWMPSNGKEFRSINIEDFAKWAEENGKRVKK
jgi:hypothetical protein